MTAPRRALVVVDVQQEYFDGPLEIQHPPRADSLAQVLRALEVARTHGLPVVVVQHRGGEGAPVFADGSARAALHPDVEAALDPSWKRVSKEFGSVFAGTDLAPWLREEGVDTITLVGYMTNNCDLASAVEAEGLGFAAEVLSDATGAIDLSNEVGSVSAEVVHTTLMVLLHSNFAAVATTERWAAAVADSTALPTSDLVSSALQGRSVAS